MALRNGKIANLPNNIREQLNLRLLEGETGKDLAAWLNALPEVQSVLASQFNASPISEVNLTLWRQGGYLQWLTERECFDSAHALAEGDGELAKTGFRAERLLNIITVRIGQLLTRWDYSPDENNSSEAAFREVTKKARILHAITRSVLAIHKIQSQRGRENLDVAKTVADSPIPSKEQTPSNPATTRGIPKPQPEAQPNGANLQPRTQPAIRNAKAETPKILAGPIAPSNLSHTPYKPEPDLSAILQAV